MTTYTPTPGGPRPGNHGCGTARTVTLTPAGFETVRQYRQAEAIAALDAGRGDGWRCYTVRTMIGGTRRVWRRREVRA